MEGIDWSELSTIGSNFKILELLMMSKIINKRKKG